MAVIFDTRELEFRIEEWLNINDYRFPLSVMATYTKQADWCDSFEEPWFSVNACATVGYGYIKVLGLEVSFLLGYNQ